MTTNFQRITESPEKLADYLIPPGRFCDNCIIVKDCGRLRDPSSERECCSAVIVKWLQEECDER